ncbi:hypothetical protein [Sulfitobacter sabulilitoris]|uniref:hypothetical protein n=1 Tax=Sulfitobacter sabulilitoris TaxID=2562655 RepID=UPI001FE662D4|nr:hypothetical protein [Sulfitobacter sabulilitoris]
MPTEHPIRGLLIATALGAAVCLGAGPVRAQAVAAAPPPQQPLSAIDWLDRNAPSATAVPGDARDPQFLDEPPVARSGSVPGITVTPLADEAVRHVGLVPPSVTGLPPDLWAGSDPDTVSALLADMPDLRLPAAQSLFYSLLLTEAQGPSGDRNARDAFSLARVEALVRLGALDPAMALIEQAGVDRDIAHFAAYMNIALLTGAEDQACARLTAMPYLAPSQAHRVFCAARGGAWDDAALMLDTGRVLDLIDPDMVQRLDRFLNADLFEDATPLRPPREIDALSFRLHDAIGEPLATRSLPRAYAVADLRDLAGWKAQLEAAERLTRTGALPDNRLLGIYTDRKPAASGGIWDRVAALQRFETALGTQSLDAVTKALPPAWRAMQQARLEAPFASLFAARVSGLDLSGPAARIAFEMGMLSPDYEAFAATAPQDMALAPAVSALARGEAPRASADDGMLAAVAAGFGADLARRDLIALARDGELGMAILRSLALLDAGARGDTAALGAGLASLRALGLEDTARRSGIQLLLLEREPG